MSTSKPREERRAREIERTRQDILEAAARVFSHGGFHAATMAAIANEAGFTAASLYTYFESKEAIYRALKDDILRRILATYDVPAPSGLSFAQRLEALLLQQLALLAERLDELRVFLDAPSSRAEERDVRAVFLERTVRFLSENGRGKLRIPPREAAHVLFGLIDARVLLWLSGEEKPDPASLATRIVDLFLHGAARPEPLRIAPHGTTAGEPQ